MSKKTSKKMSKDTAKATGNVDTREAKRLASLASTEGVSLASTFAASQLKPGGLQVTVGKTVTQKDLHSIIDSILDMSGCRTCGLTGHDFRITLQDDRLQKHFNDIKSVTNVDFTR